jgi:hypothetical protein
LFWFAINTSPPPAIPLLSLPPQSALPPPTISQLPNSGPPLLPKPKSKIITNTITKPPATYNKLPFIHFDFFTRNNNADNDSDYYT